MDPRKSYMNVNAQRMTSMASCISNLLGAGFDPLKVTTSELQEAARKLSDYNRTIKLENMAIRLYIAKRKPQDLKRIEKKKVSLMKSAAPLLYRRMTGDSLQVPSTAPELLRRTSGESIVSGKSLTSGASFTSVASGVSTVSTDSVYEIGSFEATVTRLPDKETLGMVRVAIGETQKQTKKKRLERENRMRRLRWQTHVAQGLLHDLEDVVNAYRQLELEGFSGKKLQYTLRKLIRGKQLEAQHLMLERVAKQPEMNELEKREQRWIELTKELHRVDWDKLRMMWENERKVLSDKTRQWLKSRNEAAHIGLDVHELQRKVPPALQELAKHEKTVAWTYKRANMVLHELPAVLKQVSKEEKELENRRHLLDKYEVPSVIDYVRARAMLPKKQIKLDHYKRNIPNKKVTLYNGIKLLKRLDRECHDQFQGPTAPYRLPDDIRDIMKRDIVDQTITELEKAPRIIAAARRKTRLESCDHFHKLPDVISPPASRSEPELELPMDENYIRMIGSLIVPEFGDSITELMPDSVVQRVQRPEEHSIVHQPSLFAVKMEAFSPLQCKVGPKRSSDFTLPQLAVQCRSSSKTSEIQFSFPIKVESLSSQLRLSSER